MTNIKIKELFQSNGGNDQMTFRIYKDGEWTDATEEDIKEGIKTSYGIDVDNLDKIEVYVDGEWVKGSELLKE